jgi:hypothetical protein
MDAIFLDIDLDSSDVSERRVGGSEIPQSTSSAPGRITVPGFVIGKNRNGILGGILNWEVRFFV